MADPTRGNARGIPSHSASTLPSTRVAATQEAGESGFPDLKELRDILKEVDIASMERALDKPEGGVGRRPYPRGPMIRAFLSMPVEGISNISSLRKKLMNDPALRAACGFTTRVPSRPVFSRVYSRMAELRELLEELLAATVEKLRPYLPNFGKEVALDSTMIETYSNPSREPVSDPDAGWGLKRKASAPGGVVWVFGYKIHLVVDANHDIPLAVAVTEGNRSDTTYLTAMVEETSPKPEVVIADRGYDSKDNSEWLHRRGIAPVIHKRRSKSGDYTGEDGRSYSERGTPLCPCGHERPFISTDPDTGVRVYGPVSDCERGGMLKGFSPCDFEVRVNPEGDLRLLGGAIRRDGPKWKWTYRKRWSVERVFSRWKKQNILDNHSFRGLARVRLLVQMYAITYVAARLAEVEGIETLPIAA